MLSSRNTSALSTAPSLSQQQRFEQYVRKTPTCWNWVGTRIKGYGSFWVSSQRKTVGAHRVAYEMYVGPVGNLHVLHRCDEPSCVNPAHLFLGTHQQNMDDRMAKGRHVRGERSHLAVLTAQDVIEIRDLLKHKILKRGALAKLYGVNPHTIYALSHGLSWRHIP